MLWKFMKHGSISMEITVKKTTVFKWIMYFSGGHKNWKEKCKLNTIIDLLCRLKHWTFTVSCSFLASIRYLDNCWRTGFEKNVYVHNSSKTIGLGKMVRQRGSWITVSLGKHEMLLTTIRKIRKSNVDDEYFEGYQTDVPRIY